MSTTLDEFSAEVQARLDSTPLAAEETPQDARARISREVAAEWMRFRPGKILEVLQEMEQIRARGTN